MGVRINPAVVIGLGSSGSYVVANLERILYEVVGEVPLELFRLISLDTDSRPKEDEPPPGGKRSLSYFAQVPNIGAGIRDLRQKLGPDFAWCPEDLTLIPGEGAGNLRAGGRFLLFSHFPEIFDMIRQAAHDARTAAMKEQTLRILQQQFERRRITPPDRLINPTYLVVYVVGTLAGGTCSGMCVDLGYSISRAVPEAERVGVFFMPGPTEAPVFLENTWAALKDLEYFCDNPSSFRTAWVSAAGSKQRFEARNELPFNYAYLLSSLNQEGHLRMKYGASASSPLVVMASMHLAASLLGMNSHISAAHVNITQQIQPRSKNRFFINYNLRAVSYPKYEISEAAACLIISSRICARWLNQDSYFSNSGAHPINVEDVRALGRKRWNDRFDPIWRGLSRAVDLTHFVNGIIRGTLAQPAKDLHYQLTNPVQGTVFSQVAQVLPTRKEELQKMIIDGLGSSFEQAQNIRYSELFLEGIRAELEHTIRFWDAAGTPNRADHDAWSSVARTHVQTLLSGQDLVARALAARPELLMDELQNVLTRLQMYLMKQTLGEVRSWMDNQIVPWLGTLRRSVESVRDLASHRTEVLLNQMQELEGPVLKLGRSKSESLRSEIEQIGSAEPQLRQPLLISDDGKFAGLFAVKEHQEPQDDRKIFLALKNELQPARLQALEAKGTVDVVRQVREQERISQVVEHFRDAQSMSLAARIPLRQKNPDALPSFVVAGASETANALIREMQGVMGNPPQAKPQDLPIFDHMVLFYQEGACSVQPDAEYHSIPETLTDGPTYEEHYRAKMDFRPDLLDPLSEMKAKPEASASAAE